MYKVIVALALSLPTVAMAADDYQCLQQNAGGRSSAMAWLETNDLSFADTVAKNYVVSETRMRVQTYYEDRPARTRMTCFDRNGEVVLQNFYTARPLCPINKWVGGWECDEYEVDVKKIE